MPTFNEPSSARHSAGLTRRTFLHLGALTLGGLTPQDVFRLRAAAPASRLPGQKSVIMIHLSGGPSHLAMYDMKPNAPRVNRGEFQPIKTNVPVIDLWELIPGQAKIAAEFTILRGVQLAHPGRALPQARRLVEAGVSVVTVAFHDRDIHRYNFTTLRQLLPPLDQALTDLHEPVTALLWRPRTWRLEALHARERAGGPS